MLKFNNSKTDSSNIQIKQYEKKLKNIMLDHSDINIASLILMYSVSKNTH